MGKQQEKREAVLLCGQFACELTTDELNQWFAFATDSQAIRNLLLKRAELKQAENGRVVGSELSLILDDLMDAETRVRKETERWYVGIVEARNKANANRGEKKIKNHHKGTESIEEKKIRRLR